MDTFLKITPSCKSSNVRTRCDLQQRDILTIEEVEHALRDARRDPLAVVITSVSVSLQSWLELEAA